MKINILTIFPEMFAPLTSSMLGRAAESGILDFNIVDIRRFAKDRHHKTDDYTFGGGQGLVFLAEPAFEAMRSVGGDRTRNIYLSPRGKILDGGFAAELAAMLRRDGLDVPADIIDEEGLADWLCASK